MLFHAIALALAVAPGDAVHDHARELLKSDDFEGAAALLAPHIKSRASDPEAAELLAVALLELDRRDEAAHWLAEALHAHELAGRRRDVSRVEKLLARADPLAKKRAGLVSGMVRDLTRAAEKLEKSDQPERALDLLVRLRPLAEAKAAKEIDSLIEKIGSHGAAVDLDAAGADEADEGRALVEKATEHYDLECNLENEVVELLGVTMEDIFDNFVEVYFGKKSRKAPKRRPKIRIYATWDDMAAAYPGGEPSPGLGGWWSPGSHEIHTYDERDRGGSLDGTLGTLFHEASHQFMSAFSNERGVPTWLNEGTACFFEGATAMQDGRVLWPDAALSRLVALVRDLETDKGPRPSEVLAYPGPGSYPGSYYHHGWGLVYFLQQWEHPETLEYSYRPLYLRYLDESLGKSGQSRQLFEDVFIGKDSPLGHEDVKAFLADWKQWILETVRPLHLAPMDARRVLRMERAGRYLAAADAAKESSKKAVVSEEDLLLRALRDLEYVRSVEANAAPTKDVLVQLADVLERLDREKTAAAMVETLLDEADDGRIELSEDEYAALEKRLQKLDKSNYALRGVRSRTKAHASRLRELLRDYRADHPEMVLRAFTLASAAADVLSDETDLADATSELRDEVAERGLLHGRIIAVGGPKTSWSTIFTVEPRAFRTEEGEVSMTAVRPLAMIHDGIRTSGEYEVRARIVRPGDKHLGTSHGIVVSGTRDTDWFVIGIDDEGNVGQWRARNRAGTAVLKSVGKLYLDVPVPKDASPLLAARVSTSGKIRVFLDGVEVGETKLGFSPPARANVGVFVRDGEVRLEGFVVEIFP